MITTEAINAEQTLFDVFAKAVLANPSSELVEQRDDHRARTALAEIFARGEIVGANFTRLGIGPGDIVAVQLPAWSEWLVAAVGIFRCGATLLPIVATYGATELSFILRQSQAKLLITPDRFRKGSFGEIVSDCGVLPALQHHFVVGRDVPASTLSWEVLEQPGPAIARAFRRSDDLALLVYTSGTTSAPKGVRHSHRTVIAELLAMSWQRRALTNERVLSPWPPGHVAGAISMFRFLAGRTSMVLMDQWDASLAAKLIADQRINSCSLTPFHLQGILDAAEQTGLDLSSLSNCLVGAAPVPAGLIARAAKHGLRTYRCYGSTEHPTVTSGNPDDPIEKRLKTEGLPMRGSELAFVNDDGEFLSDGVVGELVTRGPELFLGYLDAGLNDAAFLPGGWFRTGDIGCLDADGYLMITDRKKDVIIRGGENISSREVEDALFAHPDITEAAVVAGPDERYGEIVCAFITTEPGAVVTLSNIIEYFASTGLARAKTPAIVIAVEALPRNATGKVLKHELRARLADRLPTRDS